MTVTVNPQGQQTTLEGDANGDGIVGIEDLNIVREHWGETVTPGDLSSGDLNGDGLVGSGDMDILRGNWGATAPAASTYVAPSGSRANRGGPAIGGPANGSSANRGSRTGGGDFLRSNRRGIDGRRPAG